MIILKKNLNEEINLVFIIYSINFYFLIIFFRFLLECFAYLFSLRTAFQMCYGLKCGLKDYVALKSLILKILPKNFILYFILNIIFHIKNI